MKKKKKQNLLTAALAALIVLSIAAIGYVIFFHEEDTVAVKERQIKKNQKSEPSVEHKVVREKPPKALQTPGKEKNTVKDGIGANDNNAKLHSSHVPSGGKEKLEVVKAIPPVLPTRQMAIIIDDIGYDMAAVKDLLKIDTQITYAVLPGLNHSRDAAELVHQAGREVLMHLPMEPQSYPKEKPGAGALFTDMSDEEIILQMEKNFASVPYAAGVNNHMGSKFMSDEAKLLTVFKQLKKKNLFFIDSRTTRDSKTSSASREVHLTVAARKIFLDNERDYSKIYRILTEAASSQTGSTPMIVIGHPYPETIRAIRDANRVLNEKGVKVVPASQLLRKHSESGSS